MKDIEKKAEELAIALAQLPRIPASSSAMSVATVYDYKTAIALILDAWRKERQECAERAVGWLIESDLYFMPEEIETRDEDITKLRAVILKEE